MDDVDSSLCTDPWKFPNKTDISRAFYQILLAKAFRKYCGVATPFRGIRVYWRSVMGMPGSKTALEEMMCRVMGDMIQEGHVAKIADDLYCGTANPEDLLQIWTRVLEQLDRCNLRLSPTKTVICSRSTTILGWVWSQGSLSASPYRIAVLSSCPPHTTVKGMRSFVGFYKVLGRVLPGCAAFFEPLENAISGMQSQDKFNSTKVYFNRSRQHRRQPLRCPKLSCFHVRRIHCWMSLMVQLASTASVQHCTSHATIISILR